MAKLEFEFGQFLQEIEYIRSLAHKFISRESHYVLYELKTSLEGVRNAASGQSFSWGIKTQSPLVTIDSIGEYEPGGGGAHTIFATVTSTWDIEPIGLRSVASRKFAVNGIASSRIDLIERPPEGENKSLAMWRMEIGDEHSPGCHFHVQVLGTDPEPPFPHSLSVPRLPIHFATPAVALEYALGEIFQDKWYSHVANFGHSSDWGSVQKERMLKLLKWQQKVVEGASGSPWLTLKASKPEANLFT